jgi:hypothetical protein
MNQGIEILLARMDSHPDEFYNIHQQATVPPGMRWDALIREANNGKFVTEEERTALQNKLSSIQGESFTKAVLQELMGEGTRYTVDTPGVSSGGGGAYSPGPFREDPRFGYLREQLDARARENSASQPRGTSLQGLKAWVESKLP